jgi:hypothetical protein
VLKLILNDIQVRKLILREPKSGKENESVFIPQKVADRLRDEKTPESSRSVIARIDLDAFTSSVEDGRGNFRLSVAVGISFDAPPQSDLP